VKNFWKTIASSCDNYKVNQSQQKNCRRLLELWSIIASPSSKKCTVLVDVYYALFHSHLLYEIFTWISTYSILIKKLQTLQNRAMRFIERWECNIKVNDFYQKHEILNVKNLYHFEIVTKLCISIMLKIFLHRLKIIFPLSQRSNYFTRSVCRCNAIPP